MCLVLMKLESCSCDGLFGHLVCGQAFPNIPEDALIQPLYEHGIHCMDLEDQWTEQNNSVVVCVMGVMVCTVREGVGFTHRGAWAVAEGVVEP